MKRLFKARIYHKRFFPVVNEFLYTGYFIKFHLHDVQQLESRLFSVNKFNLFSFYDKDHGDRDGSSLDLWGKKILSKAGMKDFNGTFAIQTFPRVLGYVFNPVSFWYCYENEKLRAIICEVNNTFGESHNYVLTSGFESQPVFLSKNFHVSPFYDVKGGYYFDFRVPDRVKINYHFDDKLQMATSVSGSEINFNDKNLLKLFFRYPFYTFFIVFLIHIQAILLYFKKIKFYPKPDKAENEVTYE